MRNRYKKRGEREPCPDKARYLVHTMKYRALSIEFQQKTASKAA
jgi:hypothetical protein